MTDNTLFEEFVAFYNRFPISTRSGDTVSFFVNDREVEKIYNFEVHGFITITDTTRRMRGISFDIVFTEDGLNILLFDEL